MNAKQRRRFVRVELPKLKIDTATGLLLGDIPPHLAREVQNAHTLNAVRACRWHVDQCRDHGSIMWSTAGDDLDDAIDASLYAHMVGAR